LTCHSARKPDLASGVEVDFDSVYEKAIEQAIKKCDSEPICGERERTCHPRGTFGRLLLSDFVVADLTLANPNVFCELGIRHTARPFTTVPIFVVIHENRPPAAHWDQRACASGEARSLPLGSPRAA
jgi:hypothetical protein